MRPSWTNHIGRIQKSEASVTEKSLASEELAVTLPSDPEWPAPVLWEALQEAAQKRDKVL